MTLNKTSFEKAKKELEVAQDKIKPCSTWRNNKTNTPYIVIGVGIDSEEVDGEMQVKVAYTDSSDIWFRPWKLFIEKFSYIGSHISLDEVE